jgi:hypothetical protein
MPIEPSGSMFFTMTLLFRASTGMRSGGSCSHQSASPAFNAAAAVAESGMYSHSTRSTLTTLPPEAHDGASLRGT